MFTYPLFGGRNLQGYIHPGSCKFDGSANYLDWPDAAAHAGAGINDNTISTTSFWMRPGVITGAVRTIFTGAFDGNNGAICILQSTHELQFYQITGGLTDFQLQTQRVFRDPTAWYHIHYQYDSNNATPDLRQRIWVNGVEETAFVSRTNPSLAQPAYWVTNAYQTQIGTYTPTAQAFSGFLTDLHHFDGTLVDVSEFGRFNPIHNEWIPKRASGLTYPGRSFHLDFADSAALGNDVSGNNNDFAQKSIDSSDSLIDVPANTFPITNIIEALSGADYFEAGLTVNETSGTGSGSSSTHILPPGKWHWAVKKLSTGVGGYGVEADAEYESSRGGVNTIRSNRRGVSYNSNTGQIIKDGVNQFTAATLTTDDIIDIYVDNTDPTSIKFWFAKNGTQQGSGSPDPATGTDPVVTYSNSHPFPEIPQLNPGMGHDTNGGGLYDFGQRRGSDSFIATTPAGFKRLNTQNFPIPTGPALLPNKYFGVIQFEGDGTFDRVISGLDFTPDMVWLKNMDAVASWRVAINMADYVPSPSTPNNLTTDTTNAAGAFAGGNITELLAGGFRVEDQASDVSNVNANAQTIHAVCWKADPSAGFDIVRYTGNLTARTIAHNLGKVPRLIMVKRLDVAESWFIYSATYGRVTDPETDYQNLNTDGAAVDNTHWNDTAPTDSVFSIGAQAAVNSSGDDFVALLFTDIPGFLKVHCYEGNGNVNGAFLPTDFAPRFMYTKNWNAAANAQVLQDDLLDEADYNERNEALNPNSTAAIGTTTNQAYDIAANGLKRRASGAANTNGNWHAGFTYAQVASKFARAR